MSSPKELVMYARTSPCPYVSIAKRLLADLGLSYREIYIDKDPAARQRVVLWTGFESVPTLIVAELGDDFPYQEPAPLTVASPRGVNRGSMITEPSAAELEAWLKHNGLWRG
jgi:glutaredoxin